MQNEAKREALQRLVDKASRIVFFGGAGVSTESGIPDFRSADGLYHRYDGVPPETILSSDYFALETEAFYRFYREKVLHLEAVPNAAHQKLYELEKAGKLSGIVTQNIDGLHQAAGNKLVFELHGSVHRNTCLHCGRTFDAQFIRQTAGIPRCPCGGIVKPDVVLYGESLDEPTVRGALRVLSQADLLIVAGTSLTVYPAAGFVSHYEGRSLVLINRDETALDERATLLFREKVGDVLGNMKV